MQFWQTVVTYCLVFNSQGCWLQVSTVLIKSNENEIRKILSFVLREISSKFRANVFTPLAKYRRNFAWFKRYFVPTNFRNGEISNQRKFVRAKFRLTDVFARRNFLPRIRSMSHQILKRSWLVTSAKPFIRNKMLAVHFQVRVNMWIIQHAGVVSWCSPETENVNAVRITLHCIVHRILLPSVDPLQSYIWRSSQTRLAAITPKVSIHARQRIRAMTAGGLKPAEISKRIRTENLSVSFPSVARISEKVEWGLNNQPLINPRHKHSVLGGAIFSFVLAWAASVWTRLVQLQKQRSASSEDSWMRKKAKKGLWPARLVASMLFLTSHYEPVVIMGFKWSNLESAGNSTCIFFLAFEDATHAGNSAADHESAFRNFAEHSENYVRNVAARRNFARHFGELIEISCEKSLCNEISDDISNEVSPRRRNFEGSQDNGAAKFCSRRCENSMTNEISQFFAAFRCFSLIFDEILRISFSLLLISTV